MWDDESPQDHKPKEECLMVDITAGRKATGKFFTSTGLDKIKQCTTEEAHGPWHICSFQSFSTPPYLCLPLFAVSGPFCAVFNFAHLENQQ